MKNPMKFYLLIISMLMLGIPLSITAQEKTNDNEQKVRIKTVKVIDGKKVVSDTSFVLKEGDDLDNVMAGFNVGADGEDEVLVNVVVETEGGDNEKVVIIKTNDAKNVRLVQGQGGHSFYSIGTPLDFNNDMESTKIIIVSPDSGGSKVMTWQSDDGEEYVINLDEDFEKLVELEMEIDQLKDFENMDVRILGVPGHPHHPGMFFECEEGSGVSDMELRDAGIKNKADRLAIENINLNIDDGVVALSFSLKTEGSPKIVVYNFFGDKVFSGKPELMNGNYELKIDLSTKQHGVYYLQIVQKNRSFTEKLKL